MNNGSITGQFIDVMWEFAHANISRKILDQAKMCIVDYVACAYAGSFVGGTSKRLAEIAQTGGGNVPVIGAGFKASLQNAALINGIHSHIAELDDGHRVAMMHPGATIISTLFPVAQAVGGIDGLRFLKSVILGYETSIRLASVIQPSHKLMGFHGTGTCGTIGAAMALAYMLELKMEDWNTVVSAAATSASGLLEVIDDGSTLKPYNVGQASAAAINAVMVGKAGYVGPDDILGGKRGFFATHCNSLQSRNYLIEGFDDKYAIELIYRKPYAACRHCHSAIEGALVLRNKVDVHAIKEIEVLTYGLAVKGHDHCEVRGSSSAKMSTPYSMAAALVLGNTDMQAFSNVNIENPDIKEVAKKIKVIESKELSCLVPQKRAAIVRILTDKDQYETRVDYPKGEPENPITKAELEEKYHSLMNEARVDKGKSDDILVCIYDMENQFEKLIQLL